MIDPLENPVYNALCSVDKKFARGSEMVKYFDEEVSPFAGFPSGYEKGFEELHALLPKKRKILFAIPTQIQEPVGWNIVHEIKGLQFIYEGATCPATKINPRELTITDVPQMVELARLTKPGPFHSRTIEFGYYYGLFHDDKLIAMTGQRLHVDNYTEISAVCTHPAHLGKGYAGALILHQLQIILSHGQVPFLHVRDDNQRAISLYERLGFKVSRPMNFYFMVH